MVATDRAPGVRLVTDPRPLPERRTDVLVTGHGSVFLFQPLSERAREWIGDNVDGGAQWFGDALVVDHRFAPDLAAGMVCDGLSIR